MTFLQRNRVGLGTALSIVPFCLAFNSTALAQDPIDAPAEPEAETPPTEGAAPEAEAPPAEGTPPEAEAPPTEAAEAAEAAPAEAEAEAKAEVKLGGESEGAAEAEASVESEPSPETTPQPGAGAAERDAVVALVGVELLQGSAYPDTPLRGIKYGSMWRTFHGLQWPYLPPLNGEPGIRIGLSGYVWNDLSTSRIDADSSLAGSNVNDQNRWTTQTRGVVRVTPTYNAGDDWFVQGNLEAVVQGDSQPDPITKVLATTEDVWVRVGKWKLFDVTIGRFQGWEIANHFGMALDYATLERAGARLSKGSIQPPTDGYGLTFFWDRQDYTHGGYALRFYPTEYLRAEVLGHVGQGPSSADVPYQMDIRPSAIFDVGFLKLKAGWEYGTATPQDVEQPLGETKNGFGVAAQGVFEPYVDIGVSFARGFHDVLDAFGEPDLAGSNTLQTFGGFLNVSPGHEPLVFGFGAFWNSKENFRIDQATGPHQGEVDTNEQDLFFGAVQYAFWERLFVKLVLSRAVNSGAHYRDGIYTNTANGGRLRVELLY